MSDITKGFRADTLSINDQVAVTGGTADPRVTDQGSITITPKGSLYISTTGEIYQKQGTSNLNWGKLVAEDFATGNVGIGTTAPTEKLHLDGNLSLRTNAFASNGYVEFGNSGTAFSRVGRFGNSGHLDIKGVSGNTNIQMTTSGTGIFTFTTSTLERMRIDSSGNVGIGTTSPQGIFHVLSSGTPLSMIAQTTGMFQHTAAGNNSRLAIISSTAGSSVLDMGDSNAQAIHNITCSNVSNNMKFTVFNAERMRIDSSGNVGIGTTSPSSSLHVEGSILANAPGASTGSISLTSPSGVPGIVFISDNPNSYRADIRRNVTGLSLYVDSQTSNPTLRLSILNNGNVGMGIGSPITKLHVSTGGASPSPHTFDVLTLTRSGVADNVGMNLVSSTTGINRISFSSSSTLALSMIEHSNIDNSLSLHTNSAERMRIDSSGNVGIGTTTPGQKLSVAGVIESTTGGIKFPDATIQTTAALIGKFVDGTLPTDAVYTTGNVGIGLTNPSSLLHILSSGAATTSLTDTQAVFQNSATTLNCRVSIISATNGVAVLDLGDDLLQNAGSIQYNNSTDSMLFRVNNGGLGLTIDSSGNLSIPGKITSVLYVLSSGTAITPLTNTQAVFQNSATTLNCRVSIISATNGVAVLDLGDDLLQNAGSIQYNNSTDSMLFRVNNGGLGLTIDSSGNLSIPGKVGIGTTVPVTPSHVKQSSTTAAIPVETLEQLDTNEPFIEVLGTDNTTTGSILSGKTAHGGAKKFIKCKINGVVGYLQWSTVPA